MRELSGSCQANDVFGSGRVWACRRAQADRTSLRRSRRASHKFPTPSAVAIVSYGGEGEKPVKGPLGRKAARPWARLVEAWTFVVIAGRLRSRGPHWCEGTCGEARVRGSSCDTRESSRQILGKRRDSASRCKTRRTSRHAPLCRPRGKQSAPRNGSVLEKRLKEGVHEPISSDGPLRCTLAVSRTTVEVLHLGRAASCLNRRYCRCGHVFQGCKASVGWDRA